MTTKDELRKMTPAQLKQESDRIAALVKQTDDELAELDEQIQKLIDGDSIMKEDKPTTIDHKTELDRLYAECDRCFGDDWHKAFAKLSDYVEQHGLSLAQIAKIRGDWDVTLSTTANNDFWID